jgi:hypothetical protein
VERRATVIVTPRRRRRAQRDDVRSVCPVARNRDGERVEARRCRVAAIGYAVAMADTDPVTAPDTDPAYAQGDQDAEPTMTAPSGSRPDGATDADPSDEYADKPPAEGDS